MAKVIEEIMVCGDCLMVIANDDWTGIDERDAKRVERGIKSLNADGYPAVGDSEKYEAFSSCPCSCCGALPGERHHVVILGD